MHRPGYGKAMNTNGWFAKLVAAGAVSLGEIHRSTPDHIERLIGVVLIMVIFDTITGAWLAATQATLRSKTMLQKLLAKSLQYGGLFILGGGAAWITSQWALLSVTLGVILSIESVSLIENLSLLESCGGVNMGPASPFLKRVRKYLAVTYEWPTEENHGTEVGRLRKDSAGGYQGQGDPGGREHRRRTRPDSG